MLSFCVDLLGIHSFYKHMAVCFYMDFKYSLYNCISFYIISWRQNLCDACSGLLLFYVEYNIVHVTVSIVTDH